MDKNWILVFAYPSTLEDILIFDHIDTSHQVLLLGSQMSSEQDNVVSIPWVDIATWHTLVDQSYWTLVRGEVSAVASLMRGKLAFWDMYKMI
jgi:hypothetical protein